MSATKKSKGLESLITLVTTDYAGITRGRSMASSNFKPMSPMTAGWVPANMSITPFDVIANPNPWGSTGDLRLLADCQARYRFRPEGAVTDFDIVMSDIVDLDGQPWVCCPRSFLKAALADFEKETGVSLIASFEHEFQILNATWQVAPAFSLQALRRADPFGPCLMAALRDVGFKPEAFIAEFGIDQFEVTSAPAPGLIAADRAVVVREIVRELVRHRGWRATFAPKSTVDGVGNGVHIHFSFKDRKGKNATYEPGLPGRVSKLAGSFAAGIIRHLPALVAFTAPSPVSYLRLQPHLWSSSYTWFGEHDREASLRICPTHRIGGVDPAKAFNMEYRAADATACPHLALGAMVRAGLEGILQDLEAPPLFSGDPGKLPEQERKALGICRLPLSLEAALEALIGDKTVTSWFAPVAIETYVGMKRAEMKLLDGVTGDALCRRYTDVY